MPWHFRAEEVEGKAVSCSYILLYCATLCSWAKKVMTSNTPLGLSNVYCTVLHTLWHFRTLEGEEKGVSSCYIFYICTAMCSWARKFKRTPGVAQCTLNSVVHAVAF